MMATCILLIDDHALFRTGLRMVLAAGYAGSRLIEAGSLSEGLAYADEKIDVVLLDIELPGLSGLEGITLLKSRMAHVPILMLSAQFGNDTMLLAMQRGAAGFLVKSVDAEEVFRAIAAVRSGQSYFSGYRSAGESPGNATVREAPPLTPRQLEVLSLLCEGLSNKLIARKLNLAENTVRVHVAAILVYFDVVSRSQAIIAAQRRGITLR